MNSFSLPVIEWDYHFKSHETEIDIQNLFEQYKQAQKLSFTTQLSIQSTLLLGNYLKLVPHLTHLDIKILPNQLGSVGIIAISKGLWFLKRLTHLSIEVETNSVCELGCDGLARGFGYLTNLTHFCLILGKFNSIGDKGMDRICTQLQKLNNLQQLTLCILEGNGVCQESGQFLGDALKSLDNLTELKLLIEQDNFILSEGMKGISSGLAQRFKLEVLYITLIQNKIGIEGLDYLGDALSQLENLKTLHLNIHCSHLKHQTSNQISHAILNLKNLSDLFFDVSQDDEIGLGITKLVNLQNLTTILKPNLVSVLKFGQGLKQLSNLLKFKVKVESGKNPLGAEGIANICEPLKNSANLQEFGLIIDSGNNIKSEGAGHIGTCLTSLTNLKRLKLHILRNNNISEEGAQKLGQSFGSLKELETFDLQIGNLNSLTSNGLAFLSEGISNMLKVVGLKCIIGNENQLNQSGQEVFNTNIGKMKQLTHLNFSIGSENISKVGEIYKNLENLQELQFRVLLENHIHTHSFIGQGFYNLAKLKKLTFSIECGNEIGSEGLEKIGKGISHLVSLVTLSVHIGARNNIGKDGLVSLGQGISQLKNLETLCLKIEQDNNLGEEGVLGLSLELSKLAKLKKLDFQVVDPFAMSAISILESNTSLTNGNFKISQCQESEFFFARTSKEEQELLDIPFSFCLKLNTDQQIKGFYHGLEKLQSLTELSIILYHQKINTTNIQYLQQSLMQLTNLQSLEIEFNKTTAPYFPVDCLRRLCEGIKCLENLQSLSLIIKEIELGDKEKCYAYYLGSALKKLTKLEQLTFKINYTFSVQSCLKIGEGIKCLNHLRSLTFQMKHSNQVTPWFKNNVNLEKLSIYYDPQSNYTSFKIDLNELTKFKNLMSLSIINTIANSQYTMNDLQQSLLFILPYLNALRYVNISNNFDIQRKYELKIISFRNAKRLVIFKL